MCKVTWGKAHEPQPYTKNCRPLSRKVEERWPSGGKNTLIGCPMTNAQPGQHTQKNHCMDLRYVAIYKYIYAYNNNW